MASNSRLALVFELPLGDTPVSIFWLSFGVKLTKPKAPADFGDLSAPADDLRRLDFERFLGFGRGFAKGGGDGHADEDREEGALALCPGLPIGIAEE